MMLEVENSYCVEMDKCVNKLRCQALNFGFPRNEMPILCIRKIKVFFLI